MGDLEIHGIYPDEKPKVQRPLIEAGQIGHLLFGSLCRGKK